MGKIKKPPGTWFERDMYKSKAYLSLRGLAPQVLVLFLGKRHMKKIKHGKREKWNCTNGDGLSFTYVEAEKEYGITKSRFSRAVGELLAKGFVSIAHRGGGYKQDKSIGLKTFMPKYKWATNQALKSLISCPNILT